MLRQIAIAIGVVVLAANSPAKAEPCELNVWAEGNKTGRALDPDSLDPSQRSMLQNILDAGQRLYEMNPKQLVASLMLPSDTRVVIHTESQLTDKQAERTNNRLSSSAASCYIDWTFRADAAFGPTPSGAINALVLRNYGVISYYSVFKAYGATGGPFFSLKSVHQGRLPVLVGSDERKPIYNTVFGTRELIQNSARKIRDKLNGRSLIQSY
jgi:hypothetical protein